MLPGTSTTHGKCLSVSICQHVSLYAGVRSMMHADCLIDKPYEGMRAGVDELQRAPI